jgi:DNA-binding NtrC family response regulator
MQASAERRRLTAISVKRAFLTLLFKKKFREADAYVTIPARPWRLQDSNGCPPPSPSAIMTLRLVVIAAAAPTEEDFMHAVRLATPDLACEQMSWDDAVSPRLAASRPNLILLSTLPVDPAPSARRGSWPRLPSNIPRLVLLGERADGDLIRRAAEFADDFIIAPWRGGELRQRILRLIGGASPQDGGDPTAAVKTRLMQQIALSGLIGQDPQFLDAIGKIPLLARDERGPVLVVGETGTGKELCAHAIHSLGPRKNFPFIPADCATLPDHLFENEVFGHVSGAYTDARGDQKGLVSLAEGGTLFLDEIDSLSITAQTKLLRLLQERTYRPLGAARIKPCNVAIVAASNCDLESLVQARKFRADLFFRLNVLRLDLPPLRRRRSDIPLLARHFLAAVCDEAGVKRKVLTPSAAQALAEHDWPGNVRELHNAIKRAALLSENAALSTADFFAPPGGGGDGRVVSTFRAARQHAIESFERGYVEKLMRECGGNVSRAARLAGKERRAFGRLVKRYAIARDLP